MAKKSQATPSGLVVDLHAVIAAVTREVPRILTVRHRIPAPAGASIQADRDLESLPFGPLDPAGDRTLELQLRGWVQEQTGTDLGYVEQLYTFGDRNRGPRQGEIRLRGQPPRESKRPSNRQSSVESRVVSIAYLALVWEATPEAATGARWRDCYRFLPWEDWREGRPGVLDRVISPTLSRWVDEAPDAGSRQVRRERAIVAFGLRGSFWDEERVLERFELLYEMGLVQEAVRDRAAGVGAFSSVLPELALGPPADSLPPNPSLGLPLAFDHRRILATALGRLRGKLKYRPVVFELLPPTFTLLQLQRVVEALAGARLHKQNFRRLVERGGLVEGTGLRETKTGGRPAELFRFRREVLRERPAPGVGLPGTRSS